MMNSKIQQKIIELVIRKVEVSNDAWRLEYDDLLKIYIKMAFDMMVISEEEIEKNYYNLFSHL